MATSKNGFAYETIMMGFYYAGLIMRQRPHLVGSENLKNLPSQVVFAVTHDSYFEIPSLSRVYKAIDPRPVFTIMAKEEFLDGSYLSTNFFKDRALIRGFFRMLDRTGAPRAVFDKLNLISIPRPFADTHDPKYDNVKKQITDQFSKFKEKISEGFSTLVFPEGTTWGYGGLRRIRSAVYQLVSTSFEHHGKKVYILPINVKVDKLLKGWKDVFINVGKPQFFIASKEEFNQQLFHILQRLHIITFSQIGAFYLKKLSLASQQAKSKTVMSKEQLITQAEIAIADLTEKVREDILPAIDDKLLDRDYLTDKVNRFISFCLGRKYLVQHTNGESFLLDTQKVLNDYSYKSYRKKNPLGFHANELASLGEVTINEAFDAG